MKTVILLLSIIGLAAQIACAAAPQLGDTLALQVDIASVTQKQLDQFVQMGRVDDPEPFYRTYLLADTSYFYTLKVTPKDQIELDSFTALIGQGLNLLWVMNFNGRELKPLADNTAGFKNIKTEPAKPPKPEKP